MALVNQSIDNTTDAYMVEDTIHNFFKKLDEAITDMESGLVQPLDVAWAEIDAI